MPKTNIVENLEVKGKTQFYAEVKVSARHISRGISFLQVLFNYFKLLSFEITFETKLALFFQLGQC